MFKAEVDPEGSSPQAEWFRWLSEQRECADPFDELFEEIEKPIPGWYLER